MRHSPLVSALVVLSITVGLAPGCSAVLGDFSKGPGSSDAAAEDSSGGESDSSTVTDSTTPMEASPGTDSGHEGGGQEAGPTDSGMPHDAGDAGDGGCGAGNELCSGTCVSLTDPTHCGSCGHNCNTLPNVTGSTSCSAGVCSVPPTSCATGYGHCTTNPDDGCETAITTPTNCGACGTVCGTNTPLCNSSGGTYSCGTSCGGMTPNYCAGTMVCTNLQTDPNNCKACGNICPTTADGSATCTAGVCGTTCATGYHLCGALCLSNSSVSSCGSSCSACSNVVNGTPGCNGTSCDIGSCNSGYVNCSGVVSDGCNVDTQTDPNNCNGCKNVCSVPNATAACTNGTCAIGSCNAGYQDCNHSASDGCEIDTQTDSNNCGTCGHACSGGETCSGGSCACGGGTTLCGTTCVNLQTDGNNCGACGQVCNGTTCASGFCAPVVLATGATDVSVPTDIATDGGYVFWTNSTSSGWVSRVTGSGGGYMQLANGLSYPTDITVYAGEVYFTLQNNGAGVKLLNMTNTGGGLTTLDSATSWSTVGVTRPRGVAIDKVTGKTLYWATDSGGTSGYNVFKYTISGGTDSDMRSSSSGNLGGLAADNIDSMFSVPSLGWFVVYPADSAYDTGNTNPGRITAANGYFYYLVTGNGPGTGAIHSRADSSTTFSYPAQNLNQPAYIASDGTSIYWTDTSDNALYRVPVAGGPIFTLAKGAGMTALTVDTTYVYVINAANSQIVRIPK
jgi:hypothetical protein